MMQVFELTYMMIFPYMDGSGVVFRYRELLRAPELIFMHDPAYTALLIIKLLLDVLLRIPRVIVHLRG